MSTSHARKRPSAADGHRYDTAYVVVAVRLPGDHTDELAPPLVYRAEPHHHGRRERRRRR
ncbi:hypothetical protein [Dactylosporangium fulvum]|uniref:Uncharacterized protein n=1 Tax=Dactylosporangium fulvum TaxID=53359 RepID=A0ABY5W576_9ACTN|nr:hypothetical protein [Dactylosporangium fulvum]UWP85207.1 hypothetical protein Dfulv_13635 [Dactylosporangium fulvum]